MLHAVDILWVLFWGAKDITYLSLVKYMFCIDFCPWISNGVCSHIFIFEYDCSHIFIFENVLLMVTYPNGQPVGHVPW